jgi:hypothetical protein
MLYLFLALSIRAFAADPVSTAIEQAQALALKKNRQEACSTLQKAIASTPTALRSRAKLTESLTQIATVFFTDKGQKAFESGQAAMWDTPDIALAQFRSALELEDNNILLLGSVARIQLMKQDCAGALASLAEARKVNPYDSDTAILEVRAHVCQGNFDLVKEKSKTLPPLDKWQASYVQHLLAQESLLQKSFKKAFDAETKVAEEQPGFPEPFFVLAKTGAELGKETDVYLQKYVSLCKALTLRERKKYSLEPKMCTNLKEAEDELLKKSTEM